MRSSPLKIKRIGTLFWHTFRGARQLNPLFAGIHHDHRQVQRTVVQRFFTRQMKLLVPEQRTFSLFHGAAHRGFAHAETARGRPFAT